VFHRKKEYIKESGSINQQEGAYQIFTENQEHEKPAQGIKAKEKFENGYGSERNCVAFAFPIFSFILDTVFGRADESAFDIKQRLQYGFGIVDRNSGPQTHQYRQIFDAGFPVAIKDALREQVQA
jgi:hypothetical protein